MTLTREFKRYPAGVQRSAAQIVPIQVASVAAGTGHRAQAAGPVLIADPGRDKSPFINDPAAKLAYIFRFTGGAQLGP